MKLPLTLITTVKDGQVWGCRWPERSSEMQHVIFEGYEKS